MLNELRDTWERWKHKPWEGAPPAELTEAETAALFAGVGLAAAIVSYLAEHGPALQSMARTLLGKGTQPEPLFGDGFWCQNCSKVRVEKAGGYCPSCREILTTFRSARGMPATDAPLPVATRHYYVDPGLTPGGPYSLRCVCGFDTGPRADCQEATDAYDRHLPDHCKSPEQQFVEKHGE